MFSYNEGRNFAAVMVNPNGKGYVVTATNVAKGTTIIVSKVKESIDEAYSFARRFSGHVEYEMHLDAYDQYLSERLGF